MLLINQADLEKLIENRHKIPDEFWVTTSGAKYQALWFINGQKPSVSQSYDFDEERFGVTKDGQLIWGYDSGCSCPSPWSQGDYGDENYQVATYKEFFIAELPSFDEQWGTEADSNLRDYLKLIDSVDGVLNAKEVFHIRNQEVRRYIMKRIGYDNIKKDVDAAVLHTDGTSELLEIVFGDVRERYVKVKDSSTDREYLLYVPDTIKRCKQGIAWTFGLSEDQYKPLIET